MPRIDALRVACRTCDAEPSKPCRNLNGKPSKQIHARRKEDWAWAKFSFAHRPRKRWRQSPEGEALLVAANGEPCPICGHPMGPEPLIHLDHVEPFGVGGADSIENLRAICSQCNLERPKNGRDSSRVASVSV